jgi:cell wall assembly regulator SMI1
MQNPLSTKRLTCDACSDRCGQYRCSGRSTRRTDVWLSSHRVSCMNMSVVIKSVACRHPRPDLGSNLPAQVEAALAAHDSQQRPDRFLDPVSLGILIVASATLAWTVYNDQRNHTHDPPPDSIARQVRITFCDQDLSLPPRHRADHRRRECSKSPAWTRSVTPSPPASVTRAYGRGLLTLAGPASASR